MELKHGVFYGVSVGPGDPELLTLKAARVLRGSPVIAAPRTKSGEMLALDIVRQTVPLEGKEILPLSFTMERDPSLRRDAHLRAAGEIEGRLAAGRDVAMVNLGDVSIYATFGYLMELLRERGYRVMMIPGVPSFCAVAACLGTSLTRGDDPLHIISGRSEPLDAMLALPGTKVLMKSGRQIPQVAAALTRRGLAAHAAMVQDCGLPTQTVYPELTALPEEAGYFATIVVKE